MTKFTKILTGVSLLALTAGNAHALDIAIGSNSTTNTSIIDTPVVPVALAEEADETTAMALDSTYGFTLNTSSDTGFSSNQDLLLTIKLTNGEFTDDVSGGAVSSSPLIMQPPLPEPAVVDSSSIQFLPDGSASGLQGSDEVRFLVSVSNSGNQISIDLPITYDGCDAGDLGLTATLTTDGGLAIEEGTVSLETPALTCVNAYESTISSDTPASVSTADNDSKFTLASGFAQFEAGTTTEAVDPTASGTTTAGAVDTTTTASLGTVEVEFNPTGYTGTIVDNLNTLNPVDGDEVDSVEFDVTYSAPAGIDDSTLGSSTFAQVAGVSNVTNTAVPGLAVSSYIETIGVAVDGTTMISPQVPAVSNHALNFDPASNLVASEAAEEATLDDLNYRGATCGTFDWVGDQRSATNTLWRVTGHGDQVSQVFATLHDINNLGFTSGMAATETIDITNEVVGLGQPEILITNQMLAAVRPTFGRADVSFNFIGGTEGVLDCDRLQSGGTFTPFGNDNVKAADAGTDGDD